ncbi:hypothetical protein K438DRAFT_1769705 [Mycena galopus ATCC 62051]|nr:hypothetical protein K438DRAFT_1769705 [Mycena galopus ATCC 62051]
METSPNGNSERRSHHLKTVVYVTSGGTRLGLASVPGATCTPILYETNADSQNVRYAKGEGDKEAEEESRGAYPSFAGGVHSCTGEDPGALERGPRNVPVLINAVNIVQVVIDQRASMGMSSPLSSSRLRRLPVDAIAEVGGALAPVLLVLLPPPLLVFYVCAVRMGPQIEGGKSVSVPAEWKRSASTDERNSENAAVGADDEAGWRPGVKVWSRRKKQSQKLEGIKSDFGLRLLGDCDPST